MGDIPVNIFFAGAAGCAWIGADHNDHSAFHPCDAEVIGGIGGDVEADMFHDDH